jgi:hypothetical protein
MAEPARTVTFAAAPLNFTRDEALAYTGWAPKFFDLMIRNGRIAGRPWGRNGALLFAREQLEEVNRSLGGGPVNDLDDEFGIGG